MILEGGKLWWAWMITQWFHNFINLITLAIIGLKTWHVFHGFGALLRYCSRISVSKRNHSSFYIKMALTSDIITNNVLAEFWTFHKKKKKSQMLLNHVFKYHMLTENQTRIFSSWNSRANQDKAIHNLSPDIPELYTIWNKNMFGKPYASKSNSSPKFNTLMNEQKANKEQKF